MCYNLEMQAGEYRPGPFAPATGVARLISGTPGMAGAGGEGTYSPNTLRAQKADGAIFQADFESRGEPHLPANPMTIRAFIEGRVKVGKKPPPSNAM